MVCLDNIIFSLQRNGGISVYWAHLLRGLLQSGYPLRVVERHDARYNRQRQGVNLAQDFVQPEPPLPVLVSRYLPVMASLAEGGIWHSSYYRLCLARNVKQVITVYDFTYERYVTGLRHLIHARQKRWAIRSADRIICISDSTAQDLLQYYPETPPERIRVIPLGCSPAYHPLADPACDEHSPWDGRPFVLFVGDRGGYKNFGQAVQAVGLLDDMRLVAVGGGGITGQEQQLLDRHLPGRFLHHKYATEEELNRLYNQACCLLYPSAYEGFGLPLIEAMQAGCPVVAGQHSSIPEVCGTAALLVNDDAPESFAAEIRRLQSGDAHRRMREAGLMQARRFSWEDTCQKTVEVYRELLQNK